MYTPTRSLAAVPPLLLLLALDGFAATANAQVRVADRARYTNLGIIARQVFYDPVRHLIVGVAADGRTHELDGLGRVSRTPDTAGAICPYPGDPGARLEYSAAFGTRRMDSGVWTTVSTIGAPPPIAPNPIYTFAYDSVRERAVLGVRVSSVSVTTFWEFDGSRWTSIGFKNGNVAAMAYDPARQCTAVITSLGYHFDWNGSAWSTGIQVGSQRVLGLAFDRRLGRLVLLGDSFVFATHLAEFVNGSWSVVPNSNSNAPVFNLGSLVHDELRNTLAVVGADVASPVGDAVWEWNGRSWSSRSASTVHPPSGNDAMLAEDPAHGAILFGGRDVANAPSQATWLWDGTTWSQVSTSNPPSARSAGAMTRAGASSVVLFGGMDALGNPLADTWTFSVAGGWTPVLATGASARLNHALACDVAGGDRVYLHGGTTGSLWFGDLRWLDQSSFPVRWRSISTTSAPSARDTHAMAVDDVRRQIVLFGGRDASGAELGDTWVFDLANQTWSQRTPANSPGPRTNHAMVYDRARERVALFGGYSSSRGYLGDLWDWNGDDWSLRAVESGQLGGMENPAACYVGSRQRIVTFGGQAQFGVSPLDTTKEIFEHSGPVAAGQQQRLALRIDGQPISGTSAAPLIVRLENPNGPTALLVGAGNPSTRFAVVGPPAFCSTQMLYVPPVISLPGGAISTRFVIPVPVGISGFAICVQGIGITGACVDLSDSRFAVLRDPN